MKNSTLKLLTFVLSFNVFLSVKAQVGIGTTTPDASAMLDVSASNKGILIPRVSISDLSTAAPVTSPVESLLVYNTNTTTGIGYHYWDGSQWTPLSGGSTLGDNDWIVAGNNIYNANSGNVGIGTSAPSAKLHIEDNTNSTTTTVIFSDGFEDNNMAPFYSSGIGGNWSITNATGEFNTGSQAIKSGSGVQSSDSRVEVNVNAGTSGANYSFDYRISTELDYDFLYFYIDGVQAPGAKWSGNTNWTSYSGQLTPGTHTLSWVYTKDSADIDETYLDTVFIDNVLIESAPMQVPVLRIVDGGEATGRVLTSDNNGNASWSDPMIDNDWAINGNDINSINTGNIGIGTTNPIEKLHVVGRRILIEHSTDDAIFSSYNSTNNKGFDLIGTYSNWDGGAIYIGGYNVNHLGTPYDDAAQIICGGPNGSLPITATAFNIASSKNYKKNITPLTYGLDDVLKIKPVKYQYNFDKSGLYTIGFIAEEVSEIIPEIVQHQNENDDIVSSKEGKPVSMDYSKMSAVIVNAVKEQNTKVEALKKQNKLLLARLKRIEEMLQKKK